jgi:hypothetical protein
MAQSEQSRSQFFLVTFPASATIDVPQNVELAYDETKTEQQFPLQRWSVSSSNLNGVEVVFTALPFTSAADPGFKGNAKLSLALVSSTGSATWSVQNSLDQSDYSINKPAVTSAISDNAGKGFFDVGMTCLVGLSSDVPAGALTSQVIATVTGR